MKVSELATQIRGTFEASRQAVRRAHDRAVDAQQRAQRMRESMRVRTEAFDALVPGTYLKYFEEQNARAANEHQRFVAVVSHELRQPVNAAMAAMSLLDANPSDASAERARVVLRRQLRHMSTLLDDLLDLSRTTLKTMRVNREPIDLRRVVTDAVDAIESVARGEGVQVSHSLPDDPVLVLGDACRLQQALSNLLTNGIRYTAGGGRVEIVLTQKGDVVQLDVTDTGRGIAAEDLASVFEPFWRGEHGPSEGFGIGLTLVRSIVELHGGSIAVVSDGPGRGTRFSITLSGSCAVTNLS